MVCGKAKAAETVEDAKVNRNRRRKLNKEKHAAELAASAQANQLQVGRNIRERNVAASVRNARGPRPSVVYNDQNNTRSEEPSYACATDLGSEDDYEAMQEEVRRAHRGEVGRHSGLQTQSSLHQTPMQGMGFHMPIPNGGQHMHSHSAAASVSSGYTPTFSPEAGAPMQGEEIPRPRDAIMIPETGAPIHGDIITDYNTHVAYRIWKNPYLGTPLKIYRRDKWIIYRHDKWIKGLIKFLKDTPAEAPWKVHIENSKLTNVLSSELTHVDHTLVSAFVERWQPNTNTFNLPFGEMTITMHDVSIICGLPIDGNALVRQMSDEDLKMAMHDMWELGEKEIRLAWSYGGVVMTFLREWMHQLIAADGSSLHIATAYLLQLLGCSLFMDKQVSPREGSIFYSDMASVSLSSPIALSCWRDVAQTLL